MYPSADICIIPTSTRSNDIWTEVVVRGIGNGERIYPDELSDRLTASERTVRDTPRVMDSKGVLVAFHHQDGSISYGVNNRLLSAAPDRRGESEL